MRRPLALDAFLVGLYLALAALPVVAMVTELKDHRLGGTFARAPLPELTLAEVRSEQYQTRLVAWFEGKLGLRGYSLLIDNSLLYHLFGETKWDSHVKVGEGGYLFERDDIHHFNKSGATLPAPEQIEQLADDIARLQAALRARGKALVPLFVPSKTTVYPDKVSPLWTRDLGEPRPSTAHVYLAMKRALLARKVVFADGIELLLASREPREVLWGRQARHFSNYAGCLYVRATLERYTELTGTPPIELPCALTSVRTVRNHPDLDLWRLLNAWRVPRDPIGYHASHEPLPAWPPPQAPRTMWISSSFGWTMIGAAAPSRRFPQLHLAYYNSTLYEEGGDQAFPIQAFDETWNRVFPTRDLYVLELFETYLVPGQYFGEGAVRALLTALEGEPGAR